MNNVPTRKKLPTAGIYWPGPIDRSHLLFFNRGHIHYGTVAVADDDPCMFTSICDEINWPQSLTNESDLQQLVGKAELKKWYLSD
jgi:hypothetical protein